MVVSNLYITGTGWRGRKILSDESVSQTASVKTSLLVNNEATSLAIRSMTCSTTWVAERLSVRPNPYAESERRRSTRGTDRRLRQRSKSFPFYQPGGEASATRWSTLAVEPLSSWQSAVLSTIARLNSPATQRVSCTS